jgi:ribosomal protein S18 acetylase RimI-like enzyme
MQHYLETEFSTERLVADVEGPFSEVYLVLESGTAIGYIKINFAPVQTDVNDPKSLEVERIYVLKEHQGKKIGQYLMDAARDIAIKNNLDYLWLGVWDQNLKAQTFYIKNGFTQFGTHTFLLGDDEQSDLLLKLPLKH